VLQLRRWKKSIKM